MDKNSYKENDFFGLKVSFGKLTNPFVFAKSDSFKTKLTRDIFSGKFIYDKYAYFIYIFLSFSLIFLFFEHWIAFCATVLFNFSWELKNSIMICNKYHCKKICIAVCGLGFSVRNFISGLSASLFALFLTLASFLFTENKFVVFSKLVLFFFLFSFHCLYVSGVLSYMMEKFKEKITKRFNFI